MLGSSNTSIEIIHLAKARGIYTITTDYLEPEKSPAKLVSDEYWMINTSDLDVLEKKCREEGVTAVIAGVSEFNIVQMMELCRRLDLPCWCTSASWDALQNKYAFKKLCRENGLPAAKDYFVSNPPTEEELNEIQFPVVVKPVDQWLSRGVSYCNTKEEVVKACEYARSLSAVDTVIVEQKLTGDFCMAQCALADGKAALFAATASVQTSPLVHSYVTVTSNSLQTRYEEQILPSLQKLLDAAGCKEGICWTQNFLDADNQFYAIEMGYRNSGDMMTIPIHQATGFDSMNWLLDTALGVRHSAADLPSRNPLEEAKHACKYSAFGAASGTIRRIEGVETIREIPGMHVWVDVKEGQCIDKRTPMLRFVFVADTVDQVCEMIEKINASIKICGKNGENLMGYFENFEAVRSMLSR